MRNHATGCRCPDYLPVGNPLAYCERPAPPTPAEPECRIDSNCPSQLACINEHCVNPCTELKPCTSSAKCNVLDSTPLRTLTCTCPDGWISNKGGECKAVVVPKPPGCESDDDCKTEEACINRICRNPCNCGYNTQCFVKNHRPICSCKIGYDGNPHTVCKLGKYFERYKNTQRSPLQGRAQSVWRPIKYDNLEGLQPLQGSFTPKKGGNDFIGPKIVRAPNE